MCQIYWPIYSTLSGLIYYYYFLAVTGDSRCLASFEVGILNKCFFIIWASEPEDLLGCAFIILKRPCRVRLGDESKTEEREGEKLESFVFINTQLTSISIKAYVFYFKRNIKLETNLMLTSVEQDVDR